MHYLDISTALSPCTSASAKEGNAQYCSILREAIHRGFCSAGMRVSQEMTGNLTGAAARSSRGPRVVGGEKPGKPDQPHTRTARFHRDGKRGTVKNIGQPANQTHAFFDATHEK